MDQAGIYHQGISKGKHHKGPRNAGNKSMISFRAGHGISGYVGYIPSSESVPIPIKEGPSGRGPATNRDRAQPEDSAVNQATQEVLPQTVYQNTYLATASRINPASTIEAANTSQNLESSIGVASNAEESMEQTAQSAPPGPKFIAKSIYQMTYDRLQPSAEGVTKGFGRKPAYLQGSTYAGTYENSVEIKHGVGWLDSAQPRPPQIYTQKWREVSLQQGMEQSTYNLDFGAFGAGIVGQLPPNGDTNMSLHGTTRNLFAGTTKAFRRIPGYAGALPAADKNTTSAHALKQALDDHDRPDPKACRLFTLNQFLTDIPGTLTFHPKDASNLMGEPKGKSGTTTELNNAYVSKPENLAKIARARAAAPYFGGVQETKTFFQGGELSQSENGIKNAEKFYRLVRPREGVPRILRPSATTESGYRFGCYMASL